MTDVRPKATLSYSQKGFSRSRETQWHDRGAWPRCCGHTTNSRVTTHGALSLSLGRRPPLLFWMSCCIYGLLTTAIVKRIGMQHESAIEGLPSPEIFLTPNLYQRHRCAESKTSKRQVSCLISASANHPLPCCTTQPFSLSRSCLDSFNPALYFRFRSANFLSISCFRS